MPKKREYPGKTVGVVEPRKIKLPLGEEGLCLEKGGVLREVEVAYEMIGTPAPDGSNVVYVCTALTGDAHVAGIRPGAEEPDGWWEGMIGADRGIDSRHYCIICSNVLGGCQGTTGPASINPATGAPYGGAFPEITVGDMVEVHVRMLAALGITHLAAVVGGSFGGMQVLQWMVRYPEMADRCLVIASAASLNPQALGFDIIGRRAITNDPNWKGGDYYDDGAERPSDGLAQARRLAHITYLSQALMEDKFGRDRRKEWLEADEDFRANSKRLFRTTFEVESYLDHQASNFVRRFDANSYLHITRAMDEFDLVEAYGSLREALKNVKARMLVVSLSGDWLFTPEQSEAIVRTMLDLRKRVSYCHLEAPAGHDAFLTHISELSPLIHAYLPRPASEAQVPPENICEQKVQNLIIEQWIEENARVLDVGCGDGTLLKLLREQKGAIGTGVEPLFAKGVAAMEKGCSILLRKFESQSLVPDDSFDTVVLSESLQVMQRPVEALEMALKMGRSAIIVFPNFAYLPTRFQYFFRGRMPKDRHLPYEWYDTPNIHLFTLRDFEALCREREITVRRRVCLASTLFGRVLLALGCKNGAAERVIMMVERSA